ncbi:MAG: hypothetical protein ACI81R_002527 [Bradymonadia bacterium]|jgi:hypothetical protein
MVITAAPMGVPSPRVARRMAAFFAAFLASFAVTQRAQACEHTVTCGPSTLYECGPDEVPQNVRWPSVCAGFHFNELGSTSIAAFDDLLAATERSFEVWNQIDGSYLEIIFLGETNVHQSGYDISRQREENLNVVSIVEDVWPTDSPPAALALTTVIFTLSGEIVDADIEFNAARFEFDVLAQDTPGFAYDYEATLVHEVGHFAGLDHTLAESFTGPVEELGDATMAATSRAGETQKRTLHPDDVVCLLENYPEADRGAAETCDPAPNGNYYECLSSEAADGFGEFGAACVDGLDNDNDGLTDCEEPDCQVVAGCCDPKYDNETERPSNSADGCTCSQASIASGSPYALLVILGWFRRRRKRVS